MTEYLKEYDAKQLYEILGYEYKGFKLAFQKSPADLYRGSFDHFNIQSLSYQAEPILLEVIVDLNADIINDIDIVKSIFYNYVESIIARGITSGLIFLHKICIKKEAIIDKSKFPPVSYQSVIKGKFYTDINNGLINNINPVDTLTEEHLKFYRNCLFNLLYKIKPENYQVRLTCIGLTSDSYFRYMLSGYTDIPETYKDYIDNTYTLTLNGY